MTKAERDPRDRPVRFETTTFGRAALLPIPHDCDMILVCVNLLQHEPLQICLPHQLYREKIMEIFKAHPGAKSITVMPYRNADKIEISRKMRWASSATVVKKGGEG